MQTQTKPRPADHRPPVPVTLLAEIVMVIGFVLAVLGMREIGGLFNLGLGLLMISAGSVPSCSEETRIAATWMRNLGGS